MSNDPPYVFERGEPIQTGTHGEDEYLFSSNEPVPNTGVSEFAFQSGVGLGGFVGLVISDFETGLEPYIVGGNPVIVNSPVFQGSNALRIDTSNDFVQSKGETTLPYYPRPGDTIEWYLYYPDETTDEERSTAEATIVYGQTDDIIDSEDSGVFSGYNIEIDVDGLGLNLILSGDSVTADRTDVSSEDWVYDDWMRIESTWFGAGHYDARVYTPDNELIAEGEVDANNYTVDDEFGLTYYTNNPRGNNATHYWGLVQKIGEV